MLPELQAIPLDFAMRAVEEFMATDDARQATAEGLRTFLKSMRDGAAPIRQAIHRAFNENVGILSLSEISDNDLMWAHYSDRHTGTPALTTMQQDNSKQSLHRLDHGALVESCQRSWEGNVIMRTR